MRIALVTQNLDTGGGVPAIARWLRDGLIRAGHEVHLHDLASSSRDVRSRRLLRPRTWCAQLSGGSSGSGDEVFRWGANWVELEGQRYRPRAELTRVLNGYDLIQVVSGGPALALAVSKAVPPKVLQVATTLKLERRSHLPEMSPIKHVAKALSLRPLHRLEVQALRAMDHVLVENRYMQGWVRDHGQPRVTFAPPGIDTHRFRPLREWNSAGPIVAFGRLGDSRKDWPTAVEAYERFTRESGLANALILAGRGPLAPALVRKLETSPARGRITIRQDVPMTNLPELLASGSVFLQSSLEEGLGLAGLEAMACGLPVIATRTVGSAEYVKDGQNGYLVDIGRDSSRGLAGALTKVLSENGKELSAGAIASCRADYSSSRALERFLAVYAALQVR